MGEISDGSPTLRRLDLLAAAGRELCEALAMELISRWSSSRTVGWSPAIPLTCRATRVKGQRCRIFIEIELLLSNLLAAAVSVLSDSERAEVQKFIDVGEYGIALETATNIYAEEKKIPSAEVVALVERLAEAMSMKSAPLLQRLPESS